MADPSQRFRFAIDRGGTFTDIYWSRGSQEQGVLKLLSEDPKNYPDAPREGIRRILEKVGGVTCPRDKPVPTQLIESIRMGTTVATNALLERKGARMALLVTKGFRDLLHIGNQARPLIFDLKVRARKFGCTACSTARHAPACDSNVLIAPRSFRHCSAPDLAICTRP